ncbi:hypothetical protein CLF_107921, partial [Clonorchis sinensis]
MRTQRRTCVELSSLISSADDKDAVVNATPSSQVRGWIGSALYSRAVRSTDRSAITVDFEAGDDCKSPTTTRNLELLVLSATMPKSTYPIVESVITHDTDSQTRRPDNYVPENPTHTGLTTLLADYLGVHISTKGQLLRPNEPDRLDPIKNLLAGNKCYPTYKQPNRPHRQALGVKPHQEAQETERKHVQPKPLNNDDELKAENLGIFDHVHKGKGSKHIGYQGGKQLLDFPSQRRSGGGEPYVDGVPKVGRAISASSRNRRQGCSSEFHIQVTNSELDWDYCENRTTTENVKLPISSSTPSKLASLIVDTVASQDLDSQSHKPDHSEPESPSYTQLAKLIAGDSDVHTSTKERQLQPNRTHTIRQIRKLLAGFKLQSSPETSLLGAPLKEIIHGGLKRATSSSGRNFRPREETPLSKGQKTLRMKGSHRNHQADKYATEAPAKPSTQTRLPLRESDSLLLGVVYRSPSSPPEDDHFLIRTLGQLSSSYHFTHLLL